MTDVRLLLSESVDNNSIHVGVMVVVALIEKCARGELIL